VWNRRALSARAGITTAPEKPLPGSPDMRQGPLTARDERYFVILAGSILMSILICVMVFQNFWKKPQFISSRNL
jgi:hypothetical protein